jgi:uncharacterized membrane protein YkoI
MTKSLFLVALTALALTTAANAAAPTVTTIDAITAVQQQSGGVVVEVDLRTQNGTPAYHVQAMTTAGKLDFLVDGVTGKVNPMTGAVASASTDSTEAGEGPNDADSGNEDAN